MIFEDKMIQDVLDGAFIKSNEINTFENIKKYLSNIGYHTEGKYFICPYNESISCAMEYSCLGCEEFKGKEKKK
jgi:hypothetical protein